MVRTSREKIWKLFLIFICRKAGKMLGLQFCGLNGLVILTANLLKHLHILKIEGVIALLSLYCNNCYMVHPWRTHRKKICMHCALSISRKKIVNSAYISSSSVLFNFLSGHRFLNKAFAKTRQNRRVVNFSLFFSFS